MLIHKAHERSHSKSFSLSNFRDYFAVFRNPSAGRQGFLLGENCILQNVSLSALAMNDDIQDSSHGAEREDTWFEKKFGRLTNLQILIIISVLFSLFVVAQRCGCLGE
jgi:hypothetical protein